MMMMMHNIFRIKDLWKLTYVLALEVAYLPHSIVLSQKKFTSNLLRISGLETFKKVATPLPINLELYSSDSPLYSDPTKYRSLIGKLNFLTHTRPDFPFTIQALSQFMQSPTILHYSALVHTLNYVATTAGQGIILKVVDSLTLQAGFDLDLGHVWILKNVSQVI